MSLRSKYFSGWFGQGRNNQGDSLPKGRNILEFSVRDTSAGDELTLHPNPSYLYGFAIHGPDDISRLGGPPARHVLREGDQHHQVHRQLRLSYCLHNKFFFVYFFGGLECVVMFSVRGTSTTRFRPPAPPQLLPSHWNFFIVHFLWARVCYVLREGDQHHQVQTPSSASATAFTFKFFCIFFCGLECVMFSVRGTSTTRFTASSASATAFTFKINFFVYFLVGYSVLSCSLWKIFLYIFCVYWPLLCLCRPFCNFERIQIYTNS